MSSKRKRKLSNSSNDSPKPKRRKQLTLAGWRINNNTNNSNTNANTNSNNSVSNNSKPNNPNLNNNNTFADTTSNAKSNPNKRLNKTRRKKFTNQDRLSVINQIESDNKQYLSNDNEHNSVVETWINKQSKRRNMRCNLCFTCAEIAHKGQGRSDIKCGMALEDGMVYSLERLKAHFDGTGKGTSHQDVINHIKYKSEQEEMRNNALDYFARTEQQKLLLKVRSVFNEVST